MKTLRILLAGIVLLTVTGSCSSDFLDTTPTDDISSSTMFTSVDNAMMAINGIHRLMHDSDYNTKYGHGGYQMFLLVTDMMGDDLLFTKVNAKFTDCARLAWHRNTTDVDASYFYGFWNRVLGNANMIINHIEQAEGDETVRNYIHGQALTYRALSLFFLTQCYGSRYVAGQENNQLGCILNLTCEKNPMPRSTVEECYAQINRDLDQAIELLATYQKERTNKTHINQWVARAIKARVLLTQGRWSEAEQMAESVIAGSGAQLDDDTYDYQAWMTTEYRMSQVSSSEWLWGKIGVDTQEKSLKHFHSFCSNNLASYNKNTPRVINKLLYNRISNTDDRKLLWFPNAQGSTTHTYKNVEGESIKLVYPSSGNRFNYMSNKFLLPKGSSNSVTADVPYVRLPEMYLIKAEALCHQGKDAEAAEALYPLAYSRDKSYTLSTLTGEELLDEILFQRRIELWGEGFRWFDLKRLHQDLDRGPAPDTEAYPGSDKAWISAKATTSANGYNVDPNASNYNMYDTKGIGEENRHRDKDSNFWQWLFPTTETLVNPLCEQNPLGNDDK